MLFRSPHRASLRCDRNRAWGCFPDGVASERSPASLLRRTRGPNPFGPSRKRVRSRQRPAPSQYVGWARRRGVLLGASVAAPCWGKGLLCHRRQVRRCPRNGRATPDARIDFAPWRLGGVIAGVICRLPSLACVASMRKRTSGLMFPRGRRTFRPGVRGNRSEAKPPSAGESVVVVRQGVATRPCDFNAPGFCARREGVSRIFFSRRFDRLSQILNRRP